jgi:methanogenic corrinoid protein MtbC1
MASMKTITAQLKARFPAVKVLLGGAPLFPDFATTTGADLYAPDPHTP